MLKQVQFQGIKSLLDVAVDLEPFTVLVGPNGCGKSTLLDQIERLCAMTRPKENSGHTFGPAGHVVEAWSRLGERTQGAGRTVWRGESAVGTSLRFSIDWQPTTVWYSSAEEIIAGPGFAPITISPNALAKPDVLTLLHAHLNWRAQRLALSPVASAEPSEVTLTQLDPSGYGLPTVLKDMAPEHTADYLAMQVDMRQVVAAFRGIRLGKATGSDGEPLNTLDLEMVQGRFPAAQVSDGTRIALALLTVVHHPELPKIVLIDDIDHGLHLGAQYEMIKAIRAVQKVRPELQVICTTHSPILLDAFEVSEVRVMDLDSQGHTHVKPLASHPDLDRYRAVLQTGELWASTGEKWVLDDAS